MPSFKKQSKSQLNSAIRKAQNQVKRETNKAINDFERKARSYQNKLRSSSSSTIALRSAPSLYLGEDYYEDDGFAPQIGHYDETEKDYDVFISHASEDKGEIVRPLATALRNNGLDVWYDEFELRIGDSLRMKIDRGIANSNFGIIVISKDFVKKGWTNYELDGLVSRAVNGEQIILPIWHNITKREVMNFSPSLVDKVARNTTEFTVEEIADEIADLISEKKGA